MRRFLPTLTFLFASACARESTRPVSIAPEPLAHRSQSEPEASESAAASARSSEAELAQRFGAAPPIATLKGEASYYSDSLAGHATASGEPYRPAAFTAAHRKLPLGTVLRVTRTDGGQPVYVRINDRGPFGSKRRILDLSRAAAEELGILRSGVADVRVEVVAYGSTRKRGRH